MAIGDPTDIRDRIRAALPAGWFSSSNPVLDAVVAALAAPLVLVYALLSFVHRQARLATVEGLWLDLAAADFYGTTLQRNLGESDASLRARVLSGILTNAATRAALIAKVKQITGYTPRVLEPWNIADTLAYDRAPFAYDASGFYGGDLPYQAFLTVYRKPQAISQGAGAYDIAPAGYGVGLFYYGGSDAGVDVYDPAVLSAINSVKAQGTLLWVAFQTPP